METRKVYNDVIDEAYELEECEDLEEKELEHDLVDEEVNVSDDSQNYIPTPRDDDEQYQETENNTHRVYANKDVGSDQSEFEFGKPAGSTKQADIDSLNLDPETKDIFKYIKVGIENSGL